MYTPAFKPDAVNVPFAAGAVTAPVCTTVTVAVRLSTSGSASSSATVPVMLPGRTGSVSCATWTVSSATTVALALCAV